MTNDKTVTMSRELLNDLLDSARLEVDERVRSFGEDYRPHVLASLREMIADAEAILAAPVVERQTMPSEEELIANGLGYPIGKEDAVKLHFAGIRSGVITILEAWDAIGHDIGCNPSKEELLDSLRNMSEICGAHGNDMPASPPAPVAVASIPDYFVEACDKFDWTPEEALKFYAEGKHFDTENGRTRILCTGAIASYALKNIGNDYAVMKGVVDPVAGLVALPERRQYEHQGLSHTDARADGWNACLDKVKEMNR
jgi:hypothetical protein